MRVWVDVVLLSTCFTLNQKPQKHLKVVLMVIVVLPGAFGHSRERFAL